MPGLFDVSHMGQLLVHGRGADAALERLMPGDFQAAADMKPKYSLLLDDDGGIIDDLMATRRGDDFYVVVNGATKHGDIDDMRRRLPGEIVIDYMKEQALLALQGPRAAEVLEGIVPGVAELGFMQGRAVPLAGPQPVDQPLGLYRRGRVRDFGAGQRRRGRSPTRSSPIALAKPIGLGARDSLRLEAGLPLYGHDLDRATTPVMADLNFAINKRRRAEGGFAGSMRILAELENGPPQKRVGFEVEGRQPVREGALILDGEGNELGKITSGGFSPSLQRPIAMGYVATPFAEVGTALKLEQRGKLFDARVAANAVRPPPLSPQGSCLMTLYFTTEHEWIRVDGDTATVGISNHAQEALGDIVFAEVPEAGRAGDQGPGSRGGRIGQGRLRRLCARSPAK